MKNMKPFYRLTIPESLVPAMPQLIDRWYDIGGMGGITYQSNSLKKLAYQCKDQIEEAIKYGKPPDLLLYRQEIEDVFQASCRAAFLAKHGEDLIRHHANYIRCCELLHPYNWEKVKDALPANVNTKN